ncbi:MAG: permease-like cell division protein FtsX [bacterium]|nr:permease-like cell division protein FtsX [bacterium]
MIAQDFGFFVRESFIGMNRSRLMTFIAMATIAVSLIVFGFFLLLTVNLNNFTSLLTEKLEVRLFLKHSLTRSEIKEFQDRIRRLNGIKSITFVDRDDAWAEFQKNYKSMGIVGTVGKNPLPHSISLHVQKEAAIEPMVSYLKKFDYYVDDVVYGSEIAKRVESFSQFAKGAGLVLVLLLGSSTLLIIVNTIRLTVLARQEEISIMRLVGATNLFIQLPFLIEGFIIGVIGAVVAITTLSIGYNWLGDTIVASVPFMPLVFQLKQLMFIYCIVGVVGTFIGMLGAFISVSRMLRYQL